MATPQIQIESLKTGTGRTPNKGESVTVHYTGWFTDGKKFDSSVDRDEPFVFVLGAGQVIAGGDIGATARRPPRQGMHTVPPDRADGRTRSRGAIPPYSMLFAALLL